MTIRFHKDFEKQFASRLTKQQKIGALAMIDLFSRSPFDPALYNHPLKGEWHGHRSISFGGDARMHFRDLGGEVVLFVAVGSHAQLYR